MAIDTAAKRASVQSYTVGLMRPPPDGTIGEGDRASIVWLYSGIDYQSEGTPIFMDGVMTEEEWWRRRRNLYRRRRNNMLRNKQQEIWGGSRNITNPKFNPDGDLGF